MPLTSGSEGLEEAVTVGQRSSRRWQLPRVFSKGQGAVLTIYQETGNYPQEEVAWSLLPLLTSNSTHTPVTTLGSVGETSAWVATISGRQSSEKQKVGCTAPSCLQNSLYKRRHKEEFYQKNCQLINQAAHETVALSRCRVQLFNCWAFSSAV